MNNRFAALVGLCVTLAAPAQFGGSAALAAVTDPLKVIYRATSVRDDGGGALIGIATSFTCTNVGTVSERVKFRALDKSGALVGSVILTVPANHTRTTSTHLTASLIEDETLGTGGNLNQASAIISATSTKVICTAMIVDASAPTPSGIALHMIRYNAIPNTLE